MSQHIQRDPVGQTVGFTSPLLPGKGRSPSANAGSGGKGKISLQLTKPPLGSFICKPSPRNLLISSPGETPHFHPNPGPQMSRGSRGWSSASRIPTLSGSLFLPYLDKDEFTPQGHGIRELLPEAQHDSAVWEAALVVVVLLQLCKDRGKLRICPPEAARLC